MGMVYEDMGDLAKAEEELRIVVELDAAIEHPDLASDRRRSGAGTGET